MIRFALMLFSVFSSLAGNATGLGSMLEQLATQDQKSYHQPGSNNNSQMPVINLQPRHSAQESQAQKTENISDWRIIKGQTLNQVLYLWTKKAGWNLVWDANNDYVISSNATMEGDLRSAVQQLFSYTGQLTPPVNVSLYEKNKVLRVSSLNG